MIPKFRVWFGEENRWLGKHVDALLDDAVSINTDGELDAILNIAKRPLADCRPGDLGRDMKDWEYETCEISMSTGLKDKNGRDIYEGDILRGYGFDGIPQVVNESNDMDDIVSFYYWWREWGLDASDVEVVGNKWENPELLNKSAQSEEGR